MHTVAGFGWRKGRQGTEWYRVRLGDRVKAGVLSPGVRGDEPRGVSLIGGPDFGCVSVRIWPYMILLKSGGYPLGCHHLL